MVDPVADQVTRAAREEGGRVLALLARRFNDVDLADEAVQEALIEAATTWPIRGVPSNTAGWLMVVARRKALDRLRRSETVSRRTRQAVAELARVDSGVDVSDEGGASMIADDDGGTGDEHLRLVLLCCHPALDRDAQVALTLRLVGGLTTGEIASAFLLPEATLAQRIVRAKRKIRDAAIPLSIPSSLDARVDALLAVLYLIFNEGYLTRSDGAGLVRVDLIDEAIRLTRLVASVLPDDAEVDGLLALELFHQARLGTRTDAAGELVLLEDQDRSRWNLDTISEANDVLQRAMKRRRPGVFQMQALIAAHHANARTAADTDWSAIAGLYGQLRQMDPSPVIALNHAVAVAMADGPPAGLALLTTINGLDHYHLYHAARAELLHRAGRTAEAEAAFLTAEALTDNPAEQRHLQRRIAATRSRSEDGAT